MALSITPGPDRPNSDRPSSDRHSPDLQSFARLLEERGELVRVSFPVDRELEITEIADRLVKKGGPAVLFENVKGSPFPLLIGVMGTRERTALALGVSDLDDLAKKVRHLIDLKGSGGLGGLLGNVGKLRDAMNLPPRRVRSGPAQEVVWTGDEVDLSKLPILKCWPLDGGPFVTLPLVITRDPETGERNLGMYRMQVMGRNVTGMHWQRHKTGTRHLEKARRLGQKLEVAVALGGDPALIYAATAPLPPIPGLDEFALAGYLRGQRYPVMKGVTVDLDVPANAEFILEGYVDPQEDWAVEGPFGDHTGFYTLPDLYPRFHVTAMTMRRDPVYPATIVGRPPMEDAYLIEASERLFLPAAQMILPEIVDYHMPPAGVAHNLVVVSIKKTFPGQAYKVAQGLLGLGQMMFAKVIVVVDEAVKVNDFGAVWREVTAKAAPGRDTLTTRGPVDVLDHSSRGWGYGGKLIIDATTKLPEEIGSAASSREEQGQEGPLEPVFVPHAAADLPGFEGVLAQRQTPDGYWYVALHKTRPGQAQALAEAFAAHPAARSIRHLLIADEQTDVADAQDVWWTILNNIDPERDVRPLPTVSGGLLTWDGSRKLPEEGFVREWPPKIEMTPEVQRRVDARWHLYGLPERYR
ncbi:menaquinone biosynthesis decarboxylase [Deinococcus metallilatus]|uniref:4-hydroxy-3-polyprenylbenzoate decarboxylase n=1 Tax=Deinococcus metallilatus TaxID=1211322 RepID=A0AAJ5F0E0_9DEIO|nr:menaquinone biosynthesis decarboxylase [Deinococcus metallilatus]MBB5297310.1 4-hydroxy-3-polyprenylbenzoate decarboxylase [Deinococcus metallilatus]QBY10089.1 menaquinone biosynthesis decarboxylase [Deinococcus metallilatus]RXJ08249.1 menaquinone biosynthesis decarboxylase [Deinococcus metallilatus]TLK21156.1 menaquinone biosynthesis decarboxylase [Deinococcus metallilatus]GMA17126.1 menaquinone biosynthesis decarboxylase [Deinococcus metallilatus]